MKDHSTPGGPAAAEPEPGVPDLEGEALVTQITELRENVSRGVDEMTLQLDDARRRQVPASRAAVELAHAVKGAIVATGPDDVGKLLRPARPMTRRDAA